MLTWRHDGMMATFGFLARLYIMPHLSFNDSVTMYRCLRNESTSSKSAIRGNACGQTRRKPKLKWNRAPDPNSFDRYCQSIMVVFPAHLHNGLGGLIVVSDMNYPLYPTFVIRRTRHHAWKIQWPLLVLGVSKKFKWYILCNWIPTKATDEWLAGYYASSIQPHVSLSRALVRCVSMYPGE